MKTLKNALAIFTASSILTYLIFAFVKMDLNIHLWSDETRVAMVFIVLVSTVGVTTWIAIGDNL